MITECDDPDYMLRDVETQHLVLETNLDLKEFMGVRLLLDHCPNLQTLTLDILSPRPFHVRLQYIEYILLVTLLFIYISFFHSYNYGRSYIY